MNTDNLMAIGEALFHLVDNDANLQDLLRNINQFAIALIPAEVCTIWIREGQDNIIIAKGTAYPHCYINPNLGGETIKMRDGPGVGFTAHMAFQFATFPERYAVFNLSYAALVGHQAFRGGKPANPYFQTSTTSLSILCAPIRDKITNNFIAMIKVENKLNPWGFPSGESFTPDEAELLKKYADLLGNKILSHLEYDLEEKVKKLV